MWRGGGVANLPIMHREWDELVEVRRRESEEAEQQQLEHLLAIAMCSAAAPLDNNTRSALVGIDNDASGGDDHNWSRGSKRGRCAKRKRTAAAEEEEEAEAEAVRVVQIADPVMVETDAGNFRAVVQKLTGGSSTSLYWQALRLLATTTATTTTTGDHSSSSFSHSADTTICTNASVRSSSSNGRMVDLRGPSAIRALDYLAEAAVTTSDTTVVNNNLALPPTLSPDQAGLLLFTPTTTSIHDGYHHDDIYRPNSNNNNTDHTHLDVVGATICMELQDIDAAAALPSQYTPPPLIIPSFGSEPHHMMPIEYCSASRLTLISLHNNNNPTISQQITPELAVDDAYVVDIDDVPSDDQHVNMVDPYNSNYYGSSSSSSAKHNYCCGGNSLRDQAQLQTITSTKDLNPVAAAAAELPPSAAAAYHEVDIVSSSCALRHPAAAAGGGIKHAELYMWPPINNIYCS